MNIQFRGVSLTAALLSASLPAWGEQPVGTVGDLPGFSPSATFVGDARVGDLAAQVPPAPVIVDEVENSADDLQVQEVAEPAAWGQSPISYSDLKPIATDSTPYVGSGLGACDGACDSGCDSCCGGAGIGSLLDRCGSSWARAELLLWFPEQRRTPALVTTAPQGVAPQLDQAGTEVEFGGDVGGDLSPGFRIDAGRYLTDNFGVGGRFWILSQDSDSFSTSGDGTGRSIGRPFFNTNLPGPDSVLVNLNGNVRGSVAVESELEMLAAEAYGRLKFGSGPNYRVDLIGGYSHFQIDDRLWAASTTIDVGTGTADNFVDSFDAENQFHGGQIGFETILTKGCWTLTSLTKVHLGNMNQRIAIDGASSEVTTVPTVTSFDAGLLALDNQGVYERDEFAFAPELNLKLAYRFRPNVLLSVGYSFIYFDNVLLAGEHVDPVFDGSTLLTAGPYGQQDFRFNDSGLWVQGIDLGFILDF